MKNMYGALAYTSFILNLLYIVSWIYIFHNFNTHELRLRHFNSLMLFPTPITEILLVLFSVLSVIILARTHTVISKIVFIIQLLLLLLLVWQFL